MPSQRRICGHALDGILGHDSNADLTALHVDGGGVSDIVFAPMPVSTDRINLTGDHVWSDRLDLDANGLMPLLIKPLP